MRTIGLLLGTVLLAGCGGTIDDSGEEVASNVAMPLIDGKASGANGGGRLNISYHGGPVMLGTVSVYAIWYGNWSGNTATTIIPDFLSNLGNSPYFMINTGYYQTNPSGSVSGAVNYAGSVNDNYSQGTTLSSGGVQAVVGRAINNGSLPADVNGVYLVFSSSDVNQVNSTNSKLCTTYCGWHTHSTTISSVDIKYAFIGSAARCPTSCSAQTTTPNSNLEADAAANIMAHELEETITDGDLNAWYGGGFSENGDDCAWRFSPTYTVNNGSKANMKLGARDYLIQQNLINAANPYCALHL